VVPRREGRSELFDELIYAQTYVAKDAGQSLGVQDIGTMERHGRPSTGFVSKDTTGYHSI
jgi:hypothetical protein